MTNIRRKYREKPIVTLNECPKENITEESAIIDQYYGETL